MTGLNLHNWLSQKFSPPSHPPQPHSQEEETTADTSTPTSRTTTSSIMTMTIMENDCESQQQQQTKSISKNITAGYVSETGGVVVATEGEEEEVIFFDAASFSSSDNCHDVPPPKKLLDSENSLITPNDSPDPLDDSSMRKKKKDRYSKVFGENYNKKEANFVLVAAVVMSLNSGFMNGVTMSGLLTEGENHRAVGVSGLTGAWTKSGLTFGQFNWNEYIFQTSLILSYMLGSFLTGVITPCGRTYHIEPTYGPTLLLGGVLLMVSSFLAWYESDTESGPHYTFFFAAASNGIQNGIASIYSAKLIRCTMTGVSVDIALTFGQMVRGNKENKWKGVVLGLVSFNFWLGGVISFYGTRKFLHHTLFLSAGLLFLVGFALVWWLVVEMDMSIYSAIFGTWKWETTLLQLQESIAAQNAQAQSQNGTGGVDNNNASTLNHDTYMNWFDMIDQDGSGTVDADELLEALKQANIKMKLRDVKLLVKYADTSGDGLIDRDEWKVVIDKLFEKSASRLVDKSQKSLNNNNNNNNNTSGRRSSLMFIRR